MAIHQETYYKMYQPKGRCPSGVRKEMFTNAPCVLLVEHKTFIEVFWQSEADKADDYQEVTAECIENLPKGCKKITRREFNSMVG